MNDLVERLRARTVPDWKHTVGGISLMNGHKPDELCQAAADEIEQLRAVNEAFGVRQKWWTETMVEMEQEVGRLRNAALKARQLLAHMPTPDAYYLTAMSVAAELDEATGAKT